MTPQYKMEQYEWNTQSKHQMSFFVLSPQECENNFQNAVVTHVKLWPIPRFFISRILNCNVYLPVQCLSLISRHNLSQFLSSKSLCKNKISVSSTLLFSLTYKRKTRLQSYLCAHSTSPASCFWQKLTLPLPQICQKLTLPPKNFDWPVGVARTEADLTLTGCSRGRCAVGRSRDRPSELEAGTVLNI